MSETEVVSQTSPLNQIAYGFIDPTTNVFYAF